MKEAFFTAESLPETNEKLFLRQKALLDTFLEKNAITRAQYDKSLGDLTSKMGMEDILKRATENR